MKRQKKLPEEVQRKIIKADTDYMLCKLSDYAAQYKGETKNARARADIYAEGRVVQIIKDRGAQLYIVAVE